MDVALLPVHLRQTVQRVAQLRTQLVDVDVGLRQQVSDAAPFLVQQRRYFDYREGCSCRNCGSTIRVINLGKTLLEAVNLQLSRNFQFVKDFTASPEVAAAASANASLKVGCAWIVP